MKKIAVITLLICSMLCTGFSPIHAEEVPDYAEAVETVIGLNIYEVKEENLFVTRGRFASCLADILGVRAGIADSEWEDFFFDGSVDTTAVSAIVDLTEDNEYSAVSKLMMEWGFIPAQSATHFEPEEEIRYIDVLRAMVKMLGYEKFCDFNSSKKVLVKASELGLCKALNLKEKEPVTEHQLAQIIFNALDVKMALIKSNNKVEISNNVTFKNYAFKLGTATGYVTANSMTSLFSEDNHKYGYYEINNIPYEIDVNTVAEEYIGRKVKDYYTWDNTNFNKIIYVRTIDDDTLITLDAEEITGCSGNYITYHNGKRERSVNISGKKVIYNGIAASSYSDDIFDIEYGKVDISEKVVVIKSFENLIVGALNKSEKIIYDKISPKAVKINDTDNVFIYDEIGKVATFDNIAVGQVVSIMENGHYKVLYICNNTVTGVINKLSNDGDKLCIGMGDKEYRASKNIINTLNYNYIEMGNKILAYLNRYGDIVWVESKGGSGEYIRGYLKKAVYLESDECYKLWIYNEKGEHVTRILNDKVIVDNETLNKERLTSSDAYNLIKNYVGYFRYTEHKKDEDIITRFELPGTTPPVYSENKTYLLFEDAATINWYKGSYSFTNLAHASENTIVFNIPTDMKKEDDYEILSRTFFADQQTYNVKCYTSEYGTVECDAMIVSEQTSSSYSSSATRIYTITKISEGIDAEDEHVKIVEATNGKSTVQLTSLFEYEDESGNKCTIFDIAEIPGQNGTKKLSEGDLIIYVADSNNEVKRVCCVFDPAMANPDGENGFRGGVPGVNTSKYFVPVSAGVVNRENGINTIRTTKYVGTTQNSNPFAIGTSYNSSMPHIYYPAIDVMRFEMGYVYYKGDVYLQMTTQDITQEAFVPNGIPETEELITYNEESYTGIFLVDYWNYKSPEITVVDYYDGRKIERPYVEVRVGTADDIRDYLSYGTNCSRIFTVARNANGLQTVVINDYRTR